MSDLPSTELGIYALYAPNRYLAANTRVLSDPLPGKFGDQPAWDDLPELLASAIAPASRPPSRSADAFCIDVNCPFLAPNCRQREVSPSLLLDVQLPDVGRDRHDMISSQAPVG
jgi:hypothetical protein